MHKELSCIMFVLICGPVSAGCPSGYITVPKRPDTLYRVKCDTGYSDGSPIITCDQSSFNSCYAELTCNSQYKTIKTSTGASALLYGHAGGSPSIGIRLADGITCYAPLGSGGQSGAINISIEDEKYHTGQLHECLKTGTAANCHQVTSSDYSVDYTINCEGDNLIGVALCSNSGGTALTSTKSEVTTSNTASDNKYCWCTIVSPGVSYFALYGALSSANECGKSCAAKCAKEIADNISFRQVIFSTFDN